MSDDVIEQMSEAYRVALERNEHPIKAAAAVLLEDMDQIRRNAEPTTAKDLVHGYAGMIGLDLDEKNPDR